MSSISTINAEQFRSSVFFSLSIRRFGNRAKVKDMTKLAEYLAMLKGEGASPASVAGDGAVTKTTKPLIKSESLDALNTFLSETKDSMCGRFGKANPSRIREGLFVVAKPLVQEFEDNLAAALQEMREKYLPAFLEDYLPAKERAKNDAVKDGGLGPLYDEKDYPLSGELAEMFGLSWQWLALGVPDDLPAALRAQAQEKLTTQFTEAAEEIKQAMRAGFLDLIEHAAEKLKPGEEGKPRVWRDSLLANIQAFCDVFDARNIMGDEQLQALVNQAQEILIGVSPKSLREQANLREETQKKFETIKLSLETEVRKSRRFSLED